MTNCTCSREPFLKLRRRSRLTDFSNKTYKQTFIKIIKKNKKIKKNTTQTSFPKITNVF